MTSQEAATINLRQQIMNWSAAFVLVALCFV
jgi:hypothetical protein